MSAQPKVSVIMPSLNVVKYIRECIESVINQTLKDIEIICVDAGSTDGTIEVLQEYAAVDSRISLINSSIRSYGHQMNLGIDAANGEYIGIVETDDFIESNMYEVLYNIAQECASAPDIVKSSYWEYWSEKEAKKQAAPITKIKLPNTPFTAYENPQILDYHPSTVTAIYRKDFLVSKEIKYKEALGAAWTDNPFFFMTMCKADSILWVPQCLYYYRQDSDGSSSQIKDCKIPFDRVNEVFDFFEDAKIEDKGVLLSFYKRIFVYLRNILNNPYYKIDSVRPLIEKALSRMDTKIIYSNSISDFSRSLFCQYSKPRTIDIVADKPKVSVIIPVYNVEPYLRECLESVLNQTLKDIEIICVDDGSTDFSRIVLHQYQDRDNRIKLCFQKNMGAGAARNAGMKVANGEYLSFLDSDDFFEPSMLETAYYKAIETDAQIVMYRFDKYDNQKKHYIDLPHMMNPKDFPTKQVFSVFDMQKLGVNFFFSTYGWTWDKLFLKSFVYEKKLVFQNTPIFNDMYFTFSAMVSANRIAFINKIFTHQRVNRPGAISSNIQDNWPNILDSLLAVKQYLEKNYCYEILKKEFSTYALNMLIFTVNRLSGFEKNAMEIVCWKYGFRLLGLDIKNRELFLKADLLTSMNKAFPMCNEMIDKAQITSLQIEKALLTQEIANIRSSASYKIGRFITFIPRILRGGIQCYQENGLAYTTRRLLVKLHLKKEL